MSSVSMWLHRMEGISIHSIQETQIELTISISVNSVRSVIHQVEDISEQEDSPLKQKYSINELIRGVI